MQPLFTFSYSLNVTLIITRNPQKHFPLSLSLVDSASIRNIVNCIVYFTEIVTKFTAFYFKAEPLYPFPRRLILFLPWKETKQFTLTFFPLWILHVQTENPYPGNERHGPPLMKQSSAINHRSVPYFFIRECEFYQLPKLLINQSKLLWDYLSHWRR